MSSLLCVNKKLQGSWYSCCRGILIIALSYWGALWTCTIKEVHHHHLRWWWGETSPKEMLRGRRHHTAEATVCVHQNKEPGSFLPAVFLDLLCLSGSSLLLQLTEKWSGKKGKVFCAVNEPNYLADLAWMRGKDDVQERSALSVGRGSKW